MTEKAHETSEIKAQRSPSFSSPPSFLPLSSSSSHLSSPSSRATKVLANDGFYVSRQPASSSSRSDLELISSTSISAPPGILELVRPDSMVSSRTSRGRNRLPWTHGHLRHHLQLPQAHQHPSRHPKRLRHARSGLLRADSLGDLPVSLSSLSSISSAFSLLSSRL